MHRTVQNWNVNQTSLDFCGRKVSIAATSPVIRNRGKRKKRGKSSNGRKKRRTSLHRGWFAKGCRPCLYVLLTRCTSILSACLRKLISIAAETLFETNRSTVEDFLNTSPKRNRRESWTSWPIDGPSGQRSDLPKNV